MKLSKQKLKLEDNLTGELKNKIYLISANAEVSLSPKIQNALYEYLNLDFEYQALDFKTEDDVKKFLQSHAKQNLVCNVTYPYKKFVYEYLKSEGFAFSEVCKFSGGCNSLCAIDKSLENFDGEGFAKFLDLKNIDIKNKQILICGTGITAKSICFALAKKAVKSISFASRSAELKNIEEFEIATYKYHNECLKNYDIIIDATSNSISGLLNMQNLKPDAIVFDVSYTSGDTPSLRRAKELGLNAFDGRGMLISQAVLTVQKICAAYDINMHFEFEKLYNIGAQTINC